MFIVFIPQIPSLTLDDGMMRDLCPAFEQWKVPLGHAEVPGSSLASGQSQ
jgi:hypothetical protein